MRISIDSSLLLYANWSGVQIYTYRILEAMTRLADSEDRFTLRCDRAVRNEGLDLLESRANVTRCNRLGHLRFHGLLPIDILTRRHQIYYSFSGRIKTPLSCPVVLTIYDNGKYVIPDYFGSAHNSGARQHEGKLLRAQAGLITISETVKEEIVNLFEVSPEKVTVIPPAAERDDPTLPDQCPPNLRWPHYILMVNPGRAYKNWSDALSGFAEYTFLNPSDTETCLVLAGDLRGETELIERGRAEKGDGIARRILLLGHVSDQELRYLYRHARVVVLPSLYEGFGIPALEAMSYDVPLIVSDIPVLREVAGNAALRFTTGHTEELAQMFLHCIEDEALRTDLVARGQTRLADFSWERSGQGTLDTLKTIVAAG
ncbi:MAG: glycosyltransferase family 1 protein [Armatimonadota bacterium]